MVLFTPQPKRVHLPQCQCSFPVHTSLRILLSLSFLLQHFFHVAEARYPCLNDGEPVLLGQSGNEFRCECLAGFFGPFCEYQDTSQTVEGKERGSSSPTTSQIRGGWEATFVNLLLCVFFLLLLPSLIIYAVRAFYLFMKRCHSHYGHQHEQPRPMPSLQPRQNNHPTPPPQYWAAMAEEGSNGTTTIRASQIWRATGGGAHGRLWPIGQRRRQGEERGRSESPVTEVTVQLPASICRPLHGTRSVGPLAPLHQTHSLTLNEFHELLLNIQREMLTQQQSERQQHVPTTPSISSLNVPNMPPPPPPPPLLLEPPPNYELALNSTCPLQESSQRRPF